MAPLLLAKIHLCQEEMTTHHHVMITTVSKTGESYSILNCDSFIELFFSTSQSMLYSYSSRDYMSSRDSRDYGPPPRDYSYRDYPSQSSSREDYGSVSRSYRYKLFLFHLHLFVWHWASSLTLHSACSDRDSYGGGREPRGYMERTSGGSYREPYDGYGKISNFSFLEKSIRMYPNSAVCTWDKTASCQYK